MVITVLSYPAGLAVMRKYHLVTMLKFLGPRSAIQNIGWPIRIVELHNRMNVLEVDEKAEFKAIYQKLLNWVVQNFCCQVFFLPDLTL